MVTTFGVIGGGRRYAELVRLLEGDGRTVFPYGVGDGGPAEETGEGEEALCHALGAEAVVLPAPLCGGEDLAVRCAGGTLGMEEILNRLQPGQTAMAGQIPPPWAAEAEDRGLRLVDFFGRESVAVANAAATAEAAIQVAMEHSAETLLGKRCLVLGFGRIGKLLCRRLQGLGARVWASARRGEDWAWIRALGYRALDTGNLRGALGDVDIVYNTVPGPVLDRRLLAELGTESLVIDLASRPGIDLAAAQALGIPAVWARGLPGRLVPRTAAAAIRDAAYEILKEGECT